MIGEASPLHVDIRGSRDEETFLLLHGFGACAFTWRHWVPALETRGQVVLVDMKGFGAAAKPDDGRYSPRDQAELVRSLVNELNPRRLTLIGHSLGGGVSLVAALSMIDDADDRLRRLVLVGSAAYPQRLPPFVTLARYPRATRAALRVVGPERIARFALRTIVEDGDAVEPDQINAYAAGMRTPEGVRALLASARQIVPDGLEELTAAYERIDVPTLLVWGDRDRVVPLSVGRRLARSLPNARLAVLEACGHIPHEEHPRDTLRLLSDFLDGT